MTSLLRSSVLLCGPAGRALQAPLVKVAYQPRRRLVTHSISINTSRHPHGDGLRARHLDTNTTNHLHPRSMSAAAAAIQVPLDLQSVLSPQPQQQPQPRTSPPAEESTPSATHSLAAAAPQVQPTTTTTPSSSSSSSSSSASSASSPGSSSSPLSSTPSPASAAAAARRLKLRQALQPVFLTENAAARIRMLLAQQPQAKGVRLSVRTRGCSGKSYTMNYVETPDPKDEVVSQHGVTVYVDTKALFYIVGTTIDFQDDELRTEFVFNNPKKKSECGCGESFNV